MVEIYGAGGAENQALAKELFAYAKSGRIRSAIIKSGRKLDPYVTENTDDVVKFFQDLESPFPK
jgi:hypothetical protein